MFFFSLSVFFLFFLRRFFSQRGEKQTSKRTYRPTIHQAAAAA
jgi:hypothetical protein